MIVIDDTLELDGRLTFEAFKATAHYTGRHAERDGASFALGGTGCTHTITGLQGEFAIAMLFQGGLQSITLHRATPDSSVDDLGRDQLADCEALLGELAELGFKERARIVEDPHYQNFIMVQVTFNEYSAAFYKANAVWDNRETRQQAQGEDERPIRGRKTISRYKSR